MRTISFIGPMLPLFSLLNWRMSILFHYKTMNKLNYSDLTGLAYWNFFTIVKNEKTTCSLFTLHWHVLVMREHYYKYLPQYALEVNSAPHTTTHYDHTTNTTDNILLTLGSSDEVEGTTCTRHSCCQYQLIAFSVVGGPLISPDPSIANWLN